MVLRMQCSFLFKGFNAVQVVLQCETVRRRWLCISVSEQVETRRWRITDKWVMATQEEMEVQTQMQRWGTVERWRCGLDRCGASFARPQLEFCCCNCCHQCCWVTGEQRWRWWCHGGCPACRAAAASFRNRSTFLRVVVKEMSSEQKSYLTAESEMRWEIKVTFYLGTSPWCLSAGWDHQQPPWLPRLPPSTPLAPCGSTPDGPQFSEIKCYYWEWRGTHKQTTCTYTYGGLHLEIHGNMYQFSRFPWHSFSC